MARGDTFALLDAEAAGSTVGGGSAVGSWMMLGRADATSSTEVDGWALDVA